MNENRGTSKTQFHRGLVRSLILNILLICSLFLPASTAISTPAAGPWYVAPGGNDANDCLAPAAPCATINAAIGKASPGDTVFVAEGTYTGEGEQVVLIDKDLNLSGGWEADFATQNGFSIVDGQGARLGITVGNFVAVSIQRLTIQNGRGGIRSFSSNLIVLSSNIVNNTYAPGDPYDQGGGILNLGGTLELIDSSVSGNTALSGGGIANSGTMTITNSTISGNTAGKAGFRSYTGGGGIFNEGVLLLNNSSVSVNKLLGEYLGSGIFNNHIIGNGGLNVNNSTISGNNNGDGIHAVEGTVSLNSSTISNNQFRGILIDHGVVTMQNTILANIGGDCYIIPGHLGIFTSSGYNLFSKQPYGCATAPTDLENIDPALFSLMGSPGYHPLLPSSPAIDAGNPNGCTDHAGKSLDTDQRGVARVGRCDIGAYEYDPALDPLSYLSLPVTLQNYYRCLDFFDDFSDPGSGWFTGEDNEGRFEYLNGEYSALVKPESYYWVLSAPTCDRTNYTVEVDARWAGNSGASYGLIFGIQGDFEQFYSFEVNSDYQEYSLYRYDAGGWTELVPYTTSSAIHPEEQTNHLKATRNGDTITLEVNGTILGTWVDGNITGATNSGLIVSSYSDLDNAEARFDNFSVTGLGGAPNSSPTGVRLENEATGAQEDSYRNVYRQRSWR